MYEIRSLDFAGKAESTGKKSVKRLQLSLTEHHEHESFQASAGHIKVYSWPKYMSTESMGPFGNLPRKSKKKISKKKNVTIVYGNCADPFIGDVSVLFVLSFRSARSVKPSLSAAVLHPFL